MVELGDCCLKCRYIYFEYTVVIEVLVCLTLHSILCHAIVSEQCIQLNFAVYESPRLQLLPAYSSSPSQVSHVTPISGSRVVVSTIT